MARMAWKFINVGKANSRIEELETENATLKAKVAELEAAGTGVSAEVETQFEALRTENTNLKSDNTRLTSENSTLKTELASAKTAETNAKAELKTEKDTFEARSSQRAAAIAAGMGQPQQPKPGQPGAKAEPAAGEVTGIDRIQAATKKQMEKVLAEN